MTLRNAAAIVHDSSAKRFYGIIPMQAIRTLFKTRPIMAILLIAMALGMKAFVPSGYMIAPTATTMTIALCTGMDMPSPSIELTLPSKDMGKGDGGMEGRWLCPFFLQGMAGLPAVDPVLLALAITFILTLAFLPVAALQKELPPYLRPPLRGPPLSA